MKPINPNALYWASFNRFEFRVPGQAVLDCSHSGDCEADVDYWLPKVRELVESDDLPNKPAPDTIRAELEEYGAWDDEELADDEWNWKRLLWIAAGNIHDEERPDCTALIGKEASV